MRHKKSPEYLQKPKRIRKSKKDYLRGKVHNPVTKNSLDRTVFLLPYILLLSALAITIIGYTSVNFLVSRIYIPNHMYNLTRNALSVMHLPHLALPKIAIPVTAVKIPGVSLPTIQFSIIFIPIEHALRQYVPIIFSALNPIPLCLTTFSTLTIFFIASGKVIQTDIGLLSYTINPLHIWQLRIGRITDVTISGFNSIASGFTWLGITFIDYLAFIGKCLTTTWGLFSHAVLSFLSLIVQTSIFIGIHLFAETINTIIFLCESMNTSIFLLQNSIDTLQSATNTAIAGVVTGLWEIIILITTAIIHGITFLFQELFYILHAVFSMLVSILVAIYRWIIGVISAIKHMFDTLFGTIGAIIHLGDPLYAAIGETLVNLFGSIGETMQIFPKLLK